MRLNGTIFSEVLGMDTGITIVTPNQLREGKPYRVAYLLHGLCGNHQNWLDYSLLPVYASRGNTVYIMPEVGRSFYTDLQFGPLYFTYLTEELPAVCKSVFRISADREHTAVLGASMGGYGALKCALSKPEQYGMCGAFSSCCLFLQEGLAALRENKTRGASGQMDAQLVRDFQAMFGMAYTYQPDCDVLELARRLKGRTDQPKLYLTCGTADTFYPDHVRFCKALEQLGVPHIFETWDAGHDFLYFNEALRRAIDYFAL